MRKLAVVLVAALLAGILASSAFAGSTAPVKNAKVNDIGFTYAPGKLTIKKGTKVVWKWVNLGGVPHNVTVVKGPAKFRSPHKQIKGTFSHLFTKPGTYVLHCTLHPFMRETVIVK